MANGLVNLKTDLTGLKYGSMPLGSDKPYVTKNIGQAPNSQVGLEVQSRIDDTSRIAQMLVNKPGLKYLINEALLNQATNDRSIAKARKDGKSIVGAVLKQVKYTAQLVGSTLAQVPVNGTGTHFLKGFRTDTYLRPGTNEKTPGAFASFFGAGGIEGAQYALRGEVVPGEHETELLVQKNTYSNKEIHPDIDVSKDVPISSENPIQKYSKDNAFTGNTSVFNINAAKSGKPIQTQPSTSDVTRQVRNTTASSGSLGISKNNIGGSYGPNTLGIVQPTTSKYSASGSYIKQEEYLPTFNKNVTKEFRIKLGDQGAASDDKKAARRKNEYWFISDEDKRNPSGSLYIDQMNAIGVRDIKVDGNKEGRDLIKFRFHILTADGVEKVLYFRAFLDSFTDNYSGQWNPVKYLGRAEDFQIYSGFQRKISLSFKIAAATRVEMKPIYQKMIWLASATAPTYANEGQFMRGTITKITVGDYVYELPGVLNTVNYAWNTEYPWEIAMLEPEGGNGDQEMQELPTVMDCNIDFTPIHTFTPETGLKKFFTAGTRPENTYI